MIDNDWMFWPENNEAERAATLDKRMIFRNAATGEQWTEDENGERQYINTALPPGVNFKMIGGQIGDAMGNILGLLIGKPDSGGPGFRSLEVPSITGDINITNPVLNKHLMDELVGLSILKPNDGIIKGIL